MVAPTGTIFSAHDGVDHATVPMFSTASRFALPSPGSDPQRQQCNNGMDPSERLEAGAERQDSARPK